MSGALDYVNFWDPNFVGPIQPSSPAGQAITSLGYSVNAPPSNISVAFDPRTNTATVSPWHPPAASDATPWLIGGALVLGALLLRRA